MKRLSILAFAAALAAAPQAAIAWGNSGHRMIGETAVRALPAEIPAFLRTPQAALDVGEYSREPDRLKGAGKAFDYEYSPGHFVDLDDDGKVLGGPALTALPPDRESYDTALRAVGQDSWKAGYLPYAILESYQRLSKEFAYWRALKYAEANPAWKAHRAWYAADRRRREAQILLAAGQLSHFVADGSQPLHVSVHFNGWGDYPNPAGYTTSKQFHQAFEGDMVQAVVKPGEVAARIAPLRLCHCAIEQRTASYLVATGKLVPTLYAIDKAGGLRPGDARGPAFARQQLAVGASELRDMIVEAWRASDQQKVGWKPVPLADILAGKQDPFLTLYASD